MPPAAAFYRVSTDRQAEKETPLQSQKEEVHKWAIQNGYRIVKEYATTHSRADESPEHLELQRIASSDNCPFKAVLFYSWDRFIGNFDLRIYLKVLFEKHGIQLLSVTQPDLNRYEEAIMGWQDEDYVKKVRLHVRRNMEANVRMGFWNGRPPYGMELAYITTDTGNLKPILIRGDRRHIEVVQQIFDLYLQGYGFVIISTMLNDQGIVSPTGRGWCKATTREIICNPLYAGEMVWDRKTDDRVASQVPLDNFLGRPLYHVRRDGSHLTVEEKNEVLSPDMIDPILRLDVFQKAQEMRERKRKERMPRPGSGRFYPLTGHLRCGLCGSTLSGSSTESKGNQYCYYTCVGSYNVQRCKYYFARASVLEEAVFDAAGRYLSNDETVKAVTEEINRIAEAEGAVVAPQRAELKQSLAGVEKQLRSALKSVLEGNTSKMLADRMNQLERERDRVLEELQRLEAERKTQKVSEQAVRETFQHLATVFKSGTPGDVSAVLQEVVQEIVVFPGQRAEIYLKHVQDPEVVKLRALKKTR